MRTERESLFDAHVVSLNQTCSACPSQWEGLLDNGNAIYVRYRWGHLQIGVGPDINAAVDATIKPSDSNYVGGRLGDDLDGVLTYGELVAFAKDIAPGLDFAQTRETSLDW